MSSGKIAGIDEAGRGPVLGPMVICGLKISSEKMEELSKNGVKDSKDLNPGKRRKLDTLIREKAEEIEIIEFKANKIDSLRKRGVNLNEIELLGFRKILHILKPNKAYIDAASANEIEFKSDLEKTKTTDTELIVEHKADENIPIVSGASIIAKVRRDKIIREYKQEYGEIGSGYPSDGKTIDFLKEWIKENENYPKIVRKSWETAQRIKYES